MSKAMVVINMPKNCDGCDMAVEDEPVASYCPAVRDYVFLGNDTRPARCSLIPIAGYLTPEGHLIVWEDDNEGREEEAEL